MNTNHDSTTSDPLGLRRLPPRRAPERLWSSIEPRLDRPSAPTARSRRPWAGAIAAALLTALIVPQVWWTRDVAVVESPSIAEVDAGGDNAAHASDPAQDPNTELRAARALSALLENELQRARGEVLRSADMNELVWIETELRLTDDLLGDDPDNLGLWHQRIALLGRMNTRYRQNDWRQQLQLTSL